MYCPNRSNRFELPNDPVDRLIGGTMKLITV
jgi:hypothetical protein